MIVSIKTRVSPSAILACILTAVYVSGAWADTYYYHPSSSFSLGHPYDSIYPSENLMGNGMFQWSEAGFSQEPGVNEIRFDYTEIRKASDLSNSLSVDASAEAKFAFGSGSASLQYKKISEKSANEIIIAITAFREYKPKIKKGEVSLTEKASQLLTTAKDNGKLHLWRQVVGSDIVAETISGHSLTLFYHFTSSSKSKLESIRAAVAAEWASGKASANLVETAKSVDSTVSVKIDYYQTGGAEDIAVLDQVLSSQTGNVNAIKNGLKEALKSGTSENARVLRFKTLKIGSMPEVVFGTDGEFQALANYYEDILAARIIHFERLLIAQRRLGKAQRLLDEKPSKLYVAGGREKLEETKSKLASAISAIKAEYQKYQTLDNTLGSVSTNAGTTIPRLEPVTYFKTPYVKPTEWVMTNGSAARCGWSSYKDCEFHDFWVEFYPKLEFILPEFVERVRLFEGCVPKATVRKAEIQKIIASGGNFNSYFQPKYHAHKVYTWGAHHMPGAFNNWKSARGVEESQKDYIIEVSTSDADVHYVDAGAYGNHEGAGKVISMDERCGIEVILPDGSKVKKWQRND